ncbi:MAG: prepilin-type N-terminal cleavage/methylation domain-containing protein [Tissierellia bacterium]|nr:prepilin-type N-terminal cleavage/methylation domain-containing protein [Tissierellia bacterium]
MTPTTIISNGLDKKIHINDKGLTLLEVLITLAILSIVVIAFITLFTDTNLTINYSGKKTTAIAKGKSTLDEISLKAKTSKTIDGNTVKKTISKILEKDSYKIFEEDKEELYKYDKENNYKVHFLIQNQSIELEADSSSDTITSNAIKIKMVVFYDNGKKKVELSTYIPTKEDINEE